MSNAMIFFSHSLVETYVLMQINCNLMTWHKKVILKSYINLRTYWQEWGIMAYTNLEQMKIDIS